MRLACIAAILGLVGSALAGTPDFGTCGYQCTSDADCTGCGSAGRCEGKDDITRICSDAPDGAPDTPSHEPFGHPWPDVWASDMYTVTYNDFKDKIKTNTGRFYYDYPNVRQLQEFEKTKLLYVGGQDKEKSKFYFIALGGFACFYVTTDDPITKEDIGIPRPNFMKSCADAGDAYYMKRERVLGEWADRLGCEVSYDNQTISFQSFHSVGLGKVPFGVPMQLTSGDSKPTWQAPRLTTTWYYNVTTGADSAPADKFKPPSVCIPIPGQLAAKHLGIRHGRPAAELLLRAPRLAELAEPLLEEMEKHVEVVV